MVYPPHSTWISHSVAKRHIFRLYWHTKNLQTSCTVYRHRKEGINAAIRKSHFDVSSRSHVLQRTKRCLVKHPIFFPQATVYYLLDEDARTTVTTGARACSKMSCKQCVGNIGGTANRRICRCCANDEHRGDTRQRLSTRQILPLGRGRAREVFIILQNNRTIAFHRTVNRHRFDGITTRTVFCNINRSFQILARLIAKRRDPEYRLTSLTSRVPQRPSIYFFSFSFSSLFPILFFCSSFYLPYFVAMCATSSIIRNCGRPPRSQWVT